MFLLKVVFFICWVVSETKRTPARLDAVHETVAATRTFQNVLPTTLLKTLKEDCKRLQRYANTFSKFEETQASNHFHIRACFVLLEDEPTCAFSDTLLMLFYGARSKPGFIPFTK